LNAQTDDWNPRSLSSFQTFPRNSSPPGSSSPAEERTPFNGGSSSTSSSSSQHSHSKSLLADRKPVASGRNAAAHGHSRSLGESGDFSLTNGHDVVAETVQVTLGPNDRRFGFSVVGGLEEGFRPRIDEIASGSLSYIQRFRRNILHFLRGLWSRDVKSHRGD
jgi:hypothetical protein